MANEDIIKSWISLRHAPQLERFKGFTLPPATHGIFDWVVWEPDDSNATIYRTENPRSILCLAKKTSIQILLDRVGTMNSKPTLFIGGTDTCLSDLIDLLKPSLHKFRSIFYEAKDIEDRRIQSFSMGFISFYLSGAGYHNIKEAIAYSDSTDKSEVILAAWGKIWASLDDIVDDRKSAIRYLEGNALISRRMIDQDRYWYELAQYKFLMAPCGAGIQAPKLAEAWMVRTVPIVIRNPCFTDLEKLGYPLVLISNWSEITSDSLNAWLGLYNSIDWNLVRYKLTNEFIRELIRKDQEMTELD